MHQHLITNPCNVKLYMHPHAEKPNKPSNGAGSIQGIESEKSIVILNWSPPENHDRTAIDYYELTLIGTNSNTTTIVHIGAVEQQQSLSHTLVVSERNYTSASIWAVNVCGERSKPSHFVLTEIVTGDSTPTSCTILAIFLGVIALTLLISLIITLIYSVLCGDKTVPQPQESIGPRS